MVGATTIPYLGFGCIITIVSKKEKASLMLVANNAFALILLKYHQCQWGRRVNGFPANIYIMFSSICARSTMPLTKSFMQPHLTTSR